MSFVTRPPTSDPLGQEMKPEIVIYGNETIDTRKLVLTAKGEDPEEVTKLIRIAKSSPNESYRARAREMLVELYKPSVLMQAHSYSKRGTAGKGVRVQPQTAWEMKDDLVSSAWEGFFNALRLYDPDKNVPFRSYYTLHVRHQCTTEFYRHTSRVAGLDGKLWRRFLMWSKKRTSSGNKGKSWEGVLEEAAKDLGCTASDIENLLAARRAVQLEWSTCSDTGSISGVCPTFDNGFGKSMSQGGFNTPQAYELLKRKVAAAGRRRRPPSRLELSREVVRAFGSDMTPEEVANSKMFSEMYRSLVLNPRKSMKVNAETEKIRTI
jgi:hypothetical protein